MWTEKLLPAWHLGPVPTLLLLAFGLFVGRCVLLATLISPLRSIPGPWYTSFTQLVLKYHFLTGTRMYYIDALHAKYGPVVRIAPFEVGISSPDAAQAIHRVGSGFKKSAWFEKFTSITRRAHDQEDTLLRIGNIRDPRTHAARRKLYARSFTQHSLVDNWEGVVQSKVRLAVGRIRDEAARGGADLLHWWTLMATDIIAQLSFGESFQSLETGKPTPLSDAVRTAVGTGFVLTEIPFITWLAPYLPRVPLKFIQRLFEAERIIYEHGKLAVHNMRSSSDNPRNLFGQMLAQADNAENTDLTEGVVRNEAADFIVVGSDTTAVTLTYLLWAVLKRPALRDALEAEVAALSADLTQEELAAAPLLNSVMEETLRLYGAAPALLGRDVPAGGTTLCGMYIPSRGRWSSEQVVVSTQAYTLHRDPNVFPNPLEFDGWRSMKQPATPAQKAALMPFGGGTRICLGMHLAMMELRLAAALFFRECRGAQLAPGMTDEQMEMVEHFLISPKGRCIILLPHEKA